MITLFFSFCAMLLSISEPIQPDCLNKLKELNYTYEYNQEPAIMPNIRGRDRYSRHRNIIDTIPRDVVLEVKSMYNCFKLALDTDTNKVLLISYYPLAKVKKTNKEVSNQKKEHIKDYKEVPSLEAPHRRSRFRIYKFIEYYHLKNYKVYSVTNETAESDHKYKIELLDKTNSRLKAEKVNLWEECKDCPF